MNKRKLIRGLLMFFVLMVLVYSGFFLTTNIEKNREAFGQIRWSWIALALVVVSVNLGLREFKWDYFRKAAGIHEVPRNQSRLIFYSGYSMCISPGRLGEVIKPALYKEFYNTPLTRGVPVVFCERLTDLFGLVILCILSMPFFIQGYRAAQEAKGALAADSGIWWTLGRIEGSLAVCVVILAIIVGLARWKAFALGVLDKLASIGKLAKPAGKLRNLYLQTYDLLALKNIVLMSGFSAMTWFFECLGMYIVATSLGCTTFAGGVLSIYHCVFIFSIASIIGAVAIIFPGGMGPVELVMQQAMVQLGIEAAKANWVMFLTRFCTLLWGAIVGFIFLGIVARAHRDVSILDSVEAVAEGQ